MAGTMYGMALWILNYYGILSWLQPLLWDESTIVDQIPTWVAILTHVCYGATVALITYPFQKDFLTTR